MPAAPQATRLPLGKNRLPRIGGYSPVLFRELPITAIALASRPSVAKFISTKVLKEILWSTSSAWARFGTINLPAGRRAGWAIRFFLLEPKLVAMGLPVLHSPLVN